MSSAVVSMELDSRPPKKGIELVYTESQVLVIKF